MYHSNDTYRRRICQPKTGEQDYDAVADMVDVVRPVARRVCAKENVLVDVRGVDWVFCKAGLVGRYQHCARIGTHGSLLRPDASPSSAETAF